MNLENIGNIPESPEVWKKADLVLKDGKIINVFTEEIIRGDIAIQDGLIVELEALKEKKSVTLAENTYARDLLTAIST